MANTIQHKRSSTPGAAPVASSLAAGELAVNTADGVIYLKRDNGTVVASGAADNAAVAAAAAADATTKANAAQAAAVQRANHTGTQTASTISDFAAAVSAVSHSHSASDVTSGTLAIARLPVGTGSTQVAAGNDARFTDARTPLAHVHSGDDITTGTVAAARLGSGTANSTTFLRGDGTFASAPVTSVNGKIGTVVSGTVFEFTRASVPAGATGSHAAGWTWTPPADCTMLEILCVGGGGGGGSGRRGAPGTARFGGGGGSGANVTHSTYPRTLIPGALWVSVATGGPGGAARTTDDTDGATGLAGGNSQVRLGSSAGTLIAFGQPGFGGSGGSATAGAGASFNNNNNRTFAGSSGGNSSITGAAGNPLTPIGTGAAGGAAGGGVSGGNVAFAGGTQFQGNGAFYYGPYAAANTGGSGATTGDATAGASGIAYGFGGSGGGASANGFASGAGGNGNDGYVRITVW